MCYQSERLRLHQMMNGSDFTFYFFFTAVLELTASCTTSTYDSVNSARTHLSNERALKKYNNKYWGKLHDRSLSTTRRKTKITPNVWEWLNPCANTPHATPAFPTGPEMNLTRGRRAEPVVPVLSARFSSSLEGRCRADTLFASPGLRSWQLEPSHGCRVSGVIVAFHLFNAETHWPPQTPGPEMWVWLTAFSFF